MVGLETDVPFRVVQVWDLRWVQEKVCAVEETGDREARMQLWTWLLREGWGMIPGECCAELK
jgi:hypothetical protein